ncbi:zinc finger protein 629, isoform CRA_b [Mus musculus]|uniref:Zinc finger protein 629 n=2 Tax=Mus TaxID=862507 RepID=A0A087WSE9_MOUSE|nr:zinc finger protein 629, isoform CRA_b [Mus musculus]EDL17569.1 zinc finger protein 629, isoform CRA_b [Mus musculus]
MEPETVLWGPDLQGPEESQNEAHRAACKSTRATCGRGGTARRQYRQL